MNEAPIQIVTFEKIMLHLMEFIDLSTVKALYATFYIKYRTNLKHE